jgi:hypothetical protein
MLDETIIRIQLLGNIDFLEATKKIAVRSLKSEKYFHILLAQREPLPLTQFFCELLHLADWHKAALPREKEIIEKTFQYYFPLARISPEEKLLAQFFSHTNPRTPDEEGLSNPPEFLTLRDWISEDTTASEDYQINGRALNFRKQFYDLFHSDNPNKTKDAMLIFKKFLTSCTITNDILALFLCQKLNQDGVISITKPFKDSIVMRNTALPRAQQYMWNQLVFTLSITSNNNFAYPALNVQLTYFFKKNLLSAQYQPIDPDLDLSQRYLLRLQCPELIGRYTLIVFDNKVRFVRPSYEITLQSPDSALLRQDFEAYLDTLRSAASTPFFTPRSSPTLPGQSGSVRGSTVFNSALSRGSCVVQ